MLGRILPGLSGLVLLGFGILVLTAATDVSRDADLLARDTVSTRAEIIDKVTRYTAPTNSTDYRRRNEGGTTDYYLAYRFQAADGQIYESKSRVKKDYYEKTEKGVLHSVYYSESEPEVSVLFEKALEENASLGFTMGVILSMLGALLLAIAAFGPQLRRRLKWK